MSAESALPVILLVSRAPQFLVAVVFLANHHKELSHRVHALVQLGILQLVAIHAMYELYKFTYFRFAMLPARPAMEQQPLIA